MTKKLVLIGFDLEVLELLEDSKLIDIAGYVDNNNTFDELNYLGNDEKFIQSKDKDIEVVLSMDTPNVRAKLYELYKNYIVDIITHSTSNISKRAKIGCGTIIQANTFISTEVTIGKGCFLNHGSSIHHESKIGDFTILAPNSLVLGRVEIGEKCYIGAGAIVKENIVIGDNVVIGAGAVVVNNIPANSIVVGNPAKQYLGV